MLLSTVIAAAFVGRTSVVRPAKVGVPAYGYPASGIMWNQLAESEPGTVVILNPASGPGRAVDPVYVEAIAPLRARGIEIYAYVDTAYGRRPVAEILAEVATYVSWYSPSGVFLDQTPSDRDLTDYVVGLADAIHGRDLTVAINPGQPDIDRRLLDSVDHIVNFEGSLEDYRRVSFPSWVHDATGAGFWHLVYGVDRAADVDPLVGLAGENRAEMIFVTDGRLPNPWDHLPPYWTEQHRLVHGA